MDHLNLKLWIVSGYTSSFKLEILKVQDFPTFELSPMKPGLRYGPIHVMKQVVKLYSFLLVQILL